MDRCALFVDAGYLLADGAMAVHGTRHREAVSWDYPGLLQLLTALSRERTGLPMLRCYWYEATVEGRRTPEHDALADIPGLKLRLSRIRPGRREGVDAQVHRDLMTLARNSAICDAVVVSGDEDLAQVVCDAQDLGIRVTVVHIAADGNWAVSRSLRQECDDLIEIGGGHLRSYVSLTQVTATAVEPVNALANGHHQPLSAGNGQHAQHAQPAQPVQPAQPAQPVQSVQPVQPVQQSTQSSAGSSSTPPALPGGQQTLGPAPTTGSSGGHAASPSVQQSGNGQIMTSSSGSSGSSGPSGASHEGPVQRSTGGHAAPPALPSSLPSSLPSTSYPGYPAEPQQPSASAQQPPATGPATTYSPTTTGGYPPSPQLGGHYTGPQPAPVPPQQASGSGTTTLAEAVKAAHKEGHDFGESVARDAPALWLEAVLARKPRMPSDLEARLLQGSSLPIDFLLHDEVRHALRRGFWDALERARR
ncbi:NYN domain-containing protein [Spongiactinospora rosea]|uniref:NYN domain-containing protein n=1 Tax=Spongiactinospora rosea TaxID=2248750 RepID=A0A366M5T3_9ACTN|nr:NYN domain-containing protein [Spongiactinospora rosea]RBQ21407.1 NYN domain-containing protein [Spongiactinospora rosea]